MSKIYLIKYKGEYLFDIYLGETHWTSSIELARKFHSLGIVRAIKNKFDIRGKVVSQENLF